MMEETMTETFTALNANSKRTYKKENDVNSELSSICSNKDLVSPSTTNNNDWHRVLLTRLKPSMTRKYRTARKNDYKSIITPSTSIEDSNVTLQSYADDSLVIDHQQITFTQSDTSNQLDSSAEYSIRRDNRYVKNSMPNRTGDHITSLKRRVRKQQLRHFQNQAATLQETTFQLSPPNDMFVVSYPEQAVLPHRYRSKKSSCVVRLPSLVNTNRAVSTHIHDIKLNLYGY